MTALFREVGWDFVVAMMGLDMAATLDPADPKVATAIERSREIWGRVEAQAWLDRLDGSTPPVRPRRHGRHHGRGRSRRGVADPMA